MIHGAERALAHELAAKTGFDLRTCFKAIRRGPEAIRTTYVRETLARELATRVSPPGSAPDPSKANDAPTDQGGRHPHANETDGEQANPRE